jgi:hypothetical protein
VGSHSKQGAHLPQGGAGAQGQKGILEGGKAGQAAAEHCVAVHYIVHHQLGPALP